VPDEPHWDAHAAWWQEHFTAGADPEYEEQILPMAACEFPVGARVLDLGCGEGQVARRMVAGGNHVVGVDPTWPQVVEAAARGGGPAYLQCDSAALSFASDVFDGVIVCLALEHVEHLEPVVEEIARVLGPDGRLVIYLNHPLFQGPGSGWVDDQIIDPPERYWRIGPYLPEAAFVDEVQKGVFIPFFHRPLHVYVNTICRHGFVIEGLDEPRPPAGFLARAGEYQEAADVPRMLVLRARRSPRRR
jgi:SAM-dependent methyltransferase